MAQAAAERPMLVIRNLCKFTKGHAVSGFGDNFHCGTIYGDKTSPTALIITIQQLSAYRTSATSLATGLGPECAAPESWMDIMILTPTMTFLKES